MTTPIRPCPIHCLDLDGKLESPLLLRDAVHGLLAHDTATPLLAGLLVLLNVTLLDGGDELGELGLVLRSDLGDSKDSSGLRLRLDKAGTT